VLPHFADHHDDGAVAGVADAVAAARSLEGEISLAVEAIAESVVTKDLHEAVGDLDEQRRETAHRSAREHGRG